MTHLALHFQRARMRLVAEWDGLLAQELTCCSKKQNNSSQRFPFRISSAMYSDARMERDRIVIVGF